MPTPTIYPLSCHSPMPTPIIYPLSCRSSTPTPIINPLSFHSSMPTPLSCHPSMPTPIINLLSWCQELPPLLNPKPLKSQQIHSPLPQNAPRRPLLRHIAMPPSSPTHTIYKPFAPTKKMKSSTEKTKTIIQTYKLTSIKMLLLLVPPKDTNAEIFATT